MLVGKIGESHVFPAKNKTTTPNTFNTIPVIIISVIFKKPLLNIIAFGAVATGNINAKLTQNVSGSKKYTGLISFVLASRSAIGMKIDAMLVLLVS